MLSFSNVQPYNINRLSYSVTSYVQVVRDVRDCQKSDFQFGIVPQRNETRFELHFCAVSQNKLYQQRISDISKDVKNTNYSQ